MVWRNGCDCPFLILLIAIGHAGFFIPCGPLWLQLTGLRQEDLYLNVSRLIALRLMAGYSARSLVPSLPIWRKMEYLISNRAVLVCSRGFMTTIALWRS